MFDIDKSIKNKIGKQKVRGGKNDWDGDGVPNKKDCQPRNTMRQDSNIPKGWPKKVKINGKIVDVTTDNIPSVRHPVSCSGPTNDYKGKCPYCKKCYQTDDSTMYGSFLICPNCKRPI